MSRTLDFTLRLEKHGGLVKADVDLWVDQGRNGRLEDDELVAVEREPKTYTWRGTCVVEGVRTLALVYRVGYRARVGSLLTIQVTDAADGTVLDEQALVTLHAYDAHTFMIAR